MTESDTRDAALEQSSVPTLPMTAWLEAWTGLAKTLAWDGTIALGRLNQCRSPMDFAQVQRDWLLACLGASADTGLRLVGAIADAPLPNVAVEATFHLPD